MGEEGRKVGMPLEKFTDEASQDLVEGKDEIIVGGIGPRDVFLDIANKRRAAATQFARMLLGDN